MRTRRLAPYEGTAGIYDVLLGRRMVPLFLRNLGVLAARHGLLLDRGVADVGCGSGRFVLALRRRGIRAIGVDRSPRMIALARRRARRARTLGPTVGGGFSPGTEGFHIQDLRALRLERPVGLITCNFDVLNYLTDEASLRRAFQSFAANLLPGGHVLFDVIVSAGSAPPPGRRIQVLPCSGLITVWRVDLLPGGVRRAAVWVRDRSPGGRWSREVHVQRAHPRARVLRALSRTGLRTVGVHDAYSLGPPRPGRPRTVFVARTRAARYREPERRP